MVNESRYTQVHLRWMIRRDMPEVLEIEAASSDHPWGEEVFLRHLRERDVIGMVAERGEEVVGFMVYQLRPRSLRVLNFAVSPCHRRRSIGRQMVDKLRGKLAPGRRARIALAVRESNVAGQLFFRAAGFRAVEVRREHFADTGEDAYVMKYFLDAGDPSRSTRATSFSPDS